MQHSEINRYMGCRVMLRDWYRNVTQPGTVGKVTSVIKTHDEEWYIRVRLQDTVHSEELFTPDAFERLFRVLDAAALGTPNYARLH